MENEWLIVTGIGNKMTYSKEILNGADISSFTQNLFKNIHPTYAMRLMFALEVKT
jgi:hypothetical protein